MSSNKTKVLFVVNTCKDTGPTRVLYNIIKNLDRSKFEPVLLTLRDETNRSCLDEMLPCVAKHIKCKVSKTDILIGKLGKLKEAIDKIAPDVIHTTGVFPDYAISKIFRDKQLITMHNYAPSDYSIEFGGLRGRLLTKLQLIAAKKARKTIVCSKSLAKLYKKNGFDFDYIQNGIDVKKYNSKNNKNQLRDKLNLNSDAFIFVYTGHLSKRKNIAFALEKFVKIYGGREDVCFVAVGDGNEEKNLRQKYQNVKNVVFAGRVTNVDEYLGAGDVYISASKTEGLPNGVLEAAATGLPLLLSDIPQHLEVLESGEKCGYAFSLNDDSLTNLMKKIVNDRIDDLGVNARKTVETYFSDTGMTKNYQDVYTDIATDRKVTLFISSLSGGGAERVTCNLANYLNKNNYKVDVITMSNKRDTYKLDDGVKRICLLDEKERAGKIHDLCLRQKRLKKYVVSNQDVACYVVMLPITIFMLVRLKKLTRSKMIISERNNPGSYNMMEKMMMRWASRRCDGLVVQTEKIGEWYEDVEEKITIPNAINDDIVFPERDKTEKKIVAVGRLNKQKNYPVLLKAFAIFIEKHPESKLEIYGDGKQKSKIEKLIKKLGLENKVRLMGYVDNIPEKVANASCFAMSSDFEGMPNALIEAMCMGVPCVATDCDGGGARELIENGVNGFLVKRGDFKSFALKLNEVVENEELAKRISKNALEMRKKLKSDKIYNEWVGFIKKAIEN